MSKKRNYLLMEEEPPITDDMRQDIPDRKIAVGYIRVSTKQQAGEDRMGRDAQKEAISNYANENGYVIARWYTDETSGVKEHREALDEILFTDELEEAGVQAVIAYKSDRFARDIKLYFYYLFTLEKRHISLLSVNERFDDDEYGLSSVYRSLMLFVAEQERKNITMRTMAGRKVKAQKGGYAGGKRPYGYNVFGHKLVIDEDEANIVRLVFLLREQNCTMQEISDILNDRGYKTRRNGYFGASQISSILKNEKFYQGFYKYGDMDKYIKGQHEPIIFKRIKAIPDIDIMATQIAQEEAAHDEAEHEPRQYPVSELNREDEDGEDVSVYNSHPAVESAKRTDDTGKTDNTDQINTVKSDRIDANKPSNDDIELFGDSEPFQIGADIELDKVSLDETNSDNMQEILQDNMQANVQVEPPQPAPFVGGVFQG